MPLVAAIIVIIALLSGSQPRIHAPPQWHWCKLTDKDFGTAAWWKRCRGATALPK